MSRYARDPRSGNFVLVAGDGSSGVEIDYSEYIQLSEEARNFGDYFVKNVPINSSILPIGGQIPISELYDDTPTIGSLKPVTSDGIARNIDSVTTDMNVIELTTTAEHAHSVGDYFMLIGQFVKCIAAIEIGDTIIIDTNVEATNIAEVLYQLNSKIGNSDISGIGSTVTGAINNLEWKLLWTNPDMSRVQRNGMPATTITIANLSDYRFIKIMEGYGTNSGDNYYWNFSKVEEYQIDKNNDNTMYMMSVSNVGSQYSFIDCRWFYINNSTNQISFAEGYHSQANVERTQNNRACCPLYIYGMK